MLPVVRSRSGCVSFQDTWIYHCGRSSCTEVVRSLSGHKFPPVVCTNEPNSFGSDSSTCSSVPRSRRFSCVDSPMGRSKFENRSLVVFLSSVVYSVHYRDVKLRITSFPDIGNFDIVRLARINVDGSRKTNMVRRPRYYYVLFTYTVSGSSKSYIHRCGPFCLRILYPDLEKITIIWLGVRRRIQIYIIPFFRPIVYTATHLILP
jgi:hypothetical protein